MSTYRVEWPCCGRVSETENWQPETCPFCKSPNNSKIARLERELAELRAKGAASLPDVLAEYEAQTKALPCQHEIPERGCSTYNWQMAVIRDLRAMLSARPTLNPEDRTDA